MYDTKIASFLRQNGKTLVHKLPIIKSIWIRDKRINSGISYSNKINKNIFYWWQNYMWVCTTIWIYWMSFSTYIYIYTMCVIKYAAEKLICQKLRYLYFIFYISLYRYYGVVRCTLFAYHIYGNYSMGDIHTLCGNITSQNVLKSICCSIIKLVAKRKNK